MPVPPIHPLEKLLASLLHGIETLSPDKQKLMIKWAIWEAVEWHRKKMGIVVGSENRGNQLNPTVYLKIRYLKVEYDARREEGITSGLSAEDLSREDPEGEGGYRECSAVQDCNQRRESKS